MYDWAKQIGIPTKHKPPQKTRCFISRGYPPNKNATTNRLNFQKLSSCLFLECINIVKMKGMMITQKGFNQTHCALTCRMSLLQKERRKMTIFCSLLRLFYPMKELLGVQAAPHGLLVKRSLSQISLQSFPRGRSHQTQARAFLHIQQHDDLTYQQAFKRLVKQTIKNIKARAMPINLTEIGEGQDSEINTTDQVIGVVTAQGERSCKYKTIMKLILEHFSIGMPCRDQIRPTL